MFHLCCQHNIKTTPAVFYLPSSRSTAHSSLCSRQAGVPSCRRQHVELPSVPHHICTVTGGLQTASQDFSSLIPTWTSLYDCGPCNNWHYLGHIKHVDDDICRLRWLYGVCQRSIPYCHGISCVWVVSMSVLFDVQLTWGLHDCLTLRWNHLLISIQSWWRFGTVPQSCCLEQGTTQKPSVC